MSKALLMEHDVDPREVIQDRIRDYVNHVVPLGSSIMVAVYERAGGRGPVKLASGIWVAGQTTTEDLHQGKVGLVLRLGPIAFKDDDTHRFGGLAPKIGDWVVCSVGETFAFMLGETKIRLVEDVAVKAIIDQPDIVL